MTKGTFRSKMRADFPSIPDTLLEHCVEFMEEHLYFNEDVPTDSKEVA